MLAPLKEYIFSIPTDCFVPVDIAIAVDNSDSLSTSDFDNIKRFLKQLVRAFPSPEIRFSLLEYGDSATVLTDFRKYRDQIQLENLIDNMEKGVSPERRVDIALETIKDEVFSLQGGLRHGHPRYLLFVSSDDSTANFSVLEGGGKQLRDLGVTIVAIGTNRDVSEEFLQKLAGDRSFVYKAEEPGQLGDSVLGELSREMCSGNCLFPLIHAFRNEINFLFCRLRGQLEHVS